MQNTYAPQGSLPMSGLSGPQYSPSPFPPQSQYAAAQGPPTGYSPGPYATGPPMGYGQTVMSSPYSSGPPIGYGQTSSASPYPPVSGGPSTGYMPGPQQPYHMSAAQAAQQQALQRVRDQQSSLPSPVPFNGPQVAGPTHRPAGLPAKPSFQAPNMSKEEMALLHGEANFWPNGMPIRADTNHAWPPKAPESEYRQQPGALQEPNPQSMSTVDPVDDMINSVTRQGPYATNATPTPAAISARPVYDQPTTPLPQNPPESVLRRSPPESIARQRTPEPVVPRSVPEPVRTNLSAFDLSMVTRKETTKKPGVTTGKSLKYMVELEREVTPEEDTATLERYYRYQRGSLKSLRHAWEVFITEQEAKRAGQVGDILAEDPQS